MDCSGCRADGGISLNQLYYLAGPELKLTGMDLHWPDLSVTSGSLLVKFGPTGSSVKIMLNVGQSQHFQWVDCQIWRLDAKYRVSLNYISNSHSIKPSSLGINHNRWQAEQELFRLGKCKVEKEKSLSWVETKIGGTNLGLPRQLLSWWRLRSSHGWGRTVAVSAWWPPLLAGADQD